MRFAIIGLVLALAVTSLATPAQAEDDSAIFQRLIEQKSAAVVSVKLVLSVKINMMGQSRERESNSTTTGIVVDPSGLVMIPGSAFSARMGIPRGMRAQFDVKTTPLSIRVVFPGDTREYDAILGAKDSKLKLGFILIKDLGEKKITSVDLSTTVEPKIGDTLYGVTRLDQGFDHAPMCTRVKVSGSVTKPRSMWIVQGSNPHLAEPLYDAAGAVAGVVVNQDGVGEDSGSRNFLLPLKVIRPTVVSALKRAQDELERILDEEAEKAEEEAEAEKEGEGDKDKKEGEDEKEGDDDE
jgi:hypothetical protein